MKNDDITKLEFKGKFGIDGCSAGDTYPYWVIDKDTYIKIKGVKSLDLADKTETGKYKLYLTDLVDYSDEGKKQKVSIKITNE